MNIIGKILAGFFNNFFGGGGGGGADVPAPVLPGAPMPTVSDSDHHNGVVTQATPETVGGGLIQEAREDASFQTFISAMVAAVDGKSGAVLGSNLNEGSEIQFGYLRDVTHTNPDGTTWTYQELDPFAQIQANSHSHTVQNTDGEISFNGSTYWSGFFDQNKVVLGEDVTIRSNDYFSSHDEITLVGIGHQLPDMFDYAGGKG